MTTIDELLKNYREVFCLSEVEKGEHFERLMKNFLLTCPVYRGKFKNVWLWKNFPHKNQLGGKDLGIDIVAETFENNFVAVQCKFYSDNSTVEKSAVDSFISNSARKFFNSAFNRSDFSLLKFPHQRHYITKILPLLKRHKKLCKNSASGFFYLCYHTSSEVFLRCSFPHFTS